MGRFAKAWWRPVCSAACLAVWCSLATAAWATSPYQKAAIRAVEETSLSFGETLDDGLNRIYQSGKDDAEKKRERIEFLRDQLQAAKDRFS